MSFAQTVALGALAGFTIYIGLPVGRMQLMGKRARIHGSTLRARSLEEKAITARLLEKMVLPGFASGDLSVPVAATFPLADAPQAYERFKAGKKLGKIVLEMPQS